MNRRIDDQGWPRGVHAVKRPIQFFAFAWGSTVGLLVAAMWNEALVSALGRDGMLILAVTFAVVLLADLALFSLVLCRRGSSARRGRATASAGPGDAALAGGAPPR